VRWKAAVHALHRLQLWYVTTLATHYCRGRSDRSECTYDQPSNRRRNAPPQYVEALESQLRRANAILRLIIPNADLNDPDLEVKLRQMAFPPSPMRSSPSALNSTVTGEDVDGGIDDQLESMVDRAAGSG
jgi:hypothetical protein